MASLSGHKLGAPKGIGALIIRRPDLVEPLIHGGGQQQGLRPGTENVAGAVGLGEAVALAVSELPETMNTVRHLKNALAAGLTQAVPDIRVTVPEAGAPHILHLMVPDADGGALLTHLDQAGVACSTGVSLTGASRVWGSNNGNSPGSNT